MPLPVEKQRYTYADYYAWDDGKRWELFDGIPYEMFPDETRSMSPAPSSAHQSISGNLFFQLSYFLQGKTCKVFHAPFDVRLNGKGDDEVDVMQPDIIVVCDKTKIDRKGCNGAPDMIVEILSPSTAKKDKVKKFNKYQSAGVREYWIADPDSMTVIAHILENGRYITYAYSNEDNVPVRVLEGCEIDLQKVFEE